MNSSIDVRNKSFDPGLIALLMINKNNKIETPLNFPIHLKIPKPLVKMIFDYAVGEQIKITVRLLDSNEYILKVSPTTKLSEIASIFNENHKIQTKEFIQHSDFDLGLLMLELQSKIEIEYENLQICSDPKDIQDIQLRINDTQVRMDKALELYKVALEPIMLTPDHKSLRDCAIQDGHKLTLIFGD